MPSFQRTPDCEVGTRATTTPRQPTSDTKAKVINLSKWKFTETQIKLLCKGPKFCPSAKGNYIHTRVDTKELSRKLKLQEMFWDSDYRDESLVKHASQYNPKSENVELNKVLTTIECLDPVHTSDIEYNLDSAERKALDEIKDLCRSELEIKKADKGSAFVIMDKLFYRDKLIYKDHLQSDTK